MSSRFDLPNATASGSLSSMDIASTSSPHLESPPRPPSRDYSRDTQRSRVWIDPASLPNHGDITNIVGNAPDYVKQLNNNTFASYGVGGADCFGHVVGKAVKFVEVNVDSRLERQGRMEATTTAEFVVSKHMLNGAGMIHGGCVAYLIDNCCSTPLVVLGLIQNVNGVGVTQSINILFHSPASLGSRLQIISSSVSLGGRVMTSRCEVVDKDSGRVVASAFLNKMQPAMAKL